MGTTSKPPGRGAPGHWRFAGAEFHEADSRLVTGEQAQVLDRSSHEVLRYLLTHAGEVVTKEELLEAGWPGRVVSENSLAKAISRLRAALGPTADAIRAAHGYGYRLNADVVFVPARPALAAVAPSLQDGEAIPAREGWQVLRRLGEGTTGVTFLAQHRDGRQRTVKLARDVAGVHGLKREIALARYIRATDPHQRSVAPVLGWNLDTAPYFLELPYFEGGNLHEWATARGGVAALPLATRVELAASLCESVAAIHDLGVIHKDLKPENLYPVDDNGALRVVLADLGAGEATLSPQMGELGLTFSLPLGSSGAGSLAGSLPYIAPEVVSGEMPTQRSDVYALGVLLYQLLGGDLRATLAPGWESRIDEALLREDIALAADADPRRRVVDARTLARRLRCLDERRAQRDHEHAQLQDERQRAARQVRERQRRRIGMALSASLGIGLVATGWMYLRAEHARRDAEAALAQRDAVLRFVNDDILGQADPYAGNGNGTGISVRDAVDRAAARVDRQLAGDPLAAAAVHAMIGRVYFGRDDHTEAIAHLRTARARFLQGTSPPGALVRVETALCDVYRIGGHLADAERVCASALAHARRDGVGIDLALLKLGQLRGEQGRYVESQRLLSPLLDSRELRADRKLTGELHWALGLCARALGQYDAAREHFEQLLAVARELGEHSTWLGWAYNSLGSVLVETGDYARAEGVLVEAHEVFARTQGAEQIETQMPQLWRADIRLQQARWQEAADMLRGVLAAWDGKLRPGHPLRQRAEAGLAWADAMAGRREQARDALAQAMAAREIAPGQDRTAPSRTLRWTRVALALDDTAAAARLLDVFDERLRDTLPDPHPLRGDAQCLRAQWALRVADGTAAQPQAQACNATLARSQPRRDPRMQSAARVLAASGVGNSPAL